MSFNPTFHRGGGWIVITEQGVKIHKFKMHKFFLKDIPYKVISNYEVQATATFSISVLISEICAF